MRVETDLLAAPTVADIEATARELCLTSGADPEDVIEYKQGASWFQEPRWALFVPDARLSLAQERAERWGLGGPLGPRPEWNPA
jgi:hypothetical protein